MDFPHEFITRTRQLSEENYPDLEEALQKEPPVSIRINPAKTRATLPYEKVAWCETGYYLPKRPSFTFDPLFHAGNYYVQEASSMFLEQAIRQYIHTPATCLDLCAAPGGKSTHLLSILPPKSLLVSNEVIRSRSVILAENIAKWGSPYSIVTNNDPKNIGELTHAFDVIVADLPCSGEGMFRKDMDSRNEWSVANIQLCATRQRRIIHDIWNALKPGGLLIYSTCTFNREENEENIQYLMDTLQAEALPLSVNSEWNIHGAIHADFPVYRFFPHLTKGEGFFLSVLRKPEETGSKHSFKKKNLRQTMVIPPISKEWITEKYDFDIIASDTAILAFPADYPEFYRLLSDSLRIISAGVRIGEMKGKDLIPASTLALNTAFNREAFPAIELSWEEIIRFLQKEALILPSSTPKGFTVVTYRNQPIGFVKNIGSRANNLYPQTWRIRSKKLPIRPESLTAPSVKRTDLPS